MNIQFQNYKDQKPDHNENIVFIKISDFYNTWEFQYCTTEYQWDNADGSSISYDHKNPVLEDNEDGEYQLYIIIGDFSIPYNSTQTLFWAYTEDVEDQFMKEMPPEKPERVKLSGGGAH